MDRNRSDRSFRDLFDSTHAYLHPESGSFGSTDGRDLERAFVAVGSALRRDLSSILTQVRNGSSGVRRAYRMADSAIRGAYFAVYSLGAISVYPFYTITDRDIRVLNEVFDENRGFLRAFIRDAYGDRLVLPLDQRVGLYLMALRGIFERGRLEAMPGGPYDWVLGITEHCLECSVAAVSGPYQKDPYSGLGLPVLPGTPGDGSVCLGLTRCGCRYRLSSGISLPNEELAERLREVLLEVIHGD